MRANKRSLIGLTALLLLLALFCCALPLHCRCDEPECPLCALIRLRQNALFSGTVRFALLSLALRRMACGISAAFAARVRPTLYDLRIRLSI